jgi:competence protein ComEC
MGILLLVVSFIPYVNVWVGQLTEWTIQLLNWTVFKTEQLPYSLITDIHLNTFQCWLLMIFIIAIIFVFQFRSSRWLYAAFSIALLFTITQWIHFYDSVNNKKWIVYSVNGHRAMEWVDSGQSYFSCDSALLHDEERIRFHIRPYRQQNGITQIHTDIPFQKEINKINTFNWNSKVIACLNNNEASLPQQGIINYLVVSNNAITSWDDVKKMKPDQIIFDGSNSRWWVDQMMKKADADKIPVHSVIDQGAFIITN